MFYYLLNQNSKCGRMLHWENNSYSLASPDVTKEKIFTNWIFCVINVVSSCSDADMSNNNKKNRYYISFLLVSFLFEKK